jgi:hypothetical protein
LSLLAILTPAAASLKPRHTHAIPDSYGSDALSYAIDNSNGLMPRNDR